MNFHLAPADFVVAAAYLLFSVLLGMWMGRGNKTADDYLLGGRSMSWWAILGSIVSTETSAATFLSVPGLAYIATGDFRFLQLAAGYILGRIIVTIFLLPLYFRGELLTAYEILQTRFGANTRKVASGMFLVTRNLGDGLRLYLTAMTLNIVTGWGLTNCILIAGTVTILYTLYGGLKSVVWSDCIQFVVYLIAAFVTIWILIDRIPGGWGGMLEYGREHDKFRFIDLSFNLSERFTLWSGLIGGAFIALGSHGTDQMMVQRCLAAPNCRDAGKAMILSGFVVFLQFLMFLVIGTLLAAYFAAHPADQVLKADDAYMTFIVKELPAGLKGMTLAGIFAAAFTGSLNSCASTLMGDFGKWLRVDRMSDAQKVTFGRVASFIFGVVQIVVALVVAMLNSSESLVNNALTIAGLTSGVLLGVFILGQIPVKVPEKAAITGMLCALFIVVGIYLETSQYELFGLKASPFPIAFPWYPVIGSLLTVGIGLAATSFLRPSAPVAGVQD